MRPLVCEPRPRLARDPDNNGHVVRKLDAVRFVHPATACEPATLAVQKPVEDSPQIELEPFTKLLGGLIGVEAARERPGSGVAETVKEVADLPPLFSSIFEVRRFVVEKHLLRTAITMTSGRPRFCLLTASSYSHSIPDSYGSPFDLRYVG